MISALFGALLFGALALGSVFAQEQTGKLIIHESFAAKEISPYETWKVYLKASDPDGKMRSIYAVVEQRGVGPYPLSITRLKAEHQKEFSGYVYLNSAGSDVSAMNHSSVNLTIWVQGSGGNFSEPATFSVSLNNRYKQEPPPAGRFEEKELGPIMILLRVPFESTKAWTVD